MIINRSNFDEQLYSDILPGKAFVISEDRSEILYMKIQYRDAAVTLREGNIDFNIQPNTMCRVIKNGTFSW